jgi:hypothetical protein
VLLDRRIGPTRSEVLALGGVLVAGALLLARHLGVPSFEFDEQVYLASADLLRRGFELGRDVFTSQPPLFFSFLRAAAGLTGGDATVMRAMSVALTLLGALAGWAIVRPRAGRLAGLATASLLIMAPGVVDAAAVVSADVPSVALGTLALLTAQLAIRRPAWALGSGALLACALLTKLLAAPFAAAILALAIVHRPPPRTMALFAAGFAAVAVAVLAAYASVLGSLWSGAVGLHLAARGADLHFPTDSIVAIVVLIVLAYLGLLAIVAVGLLDPGRDRLRTWARDRADLLVLLADGIALCAVQRPVQSHHLVIIAWPLALLAGSALPAHAARRRTAALVALGVVLVLPWAIHGRSLESRGERRVLLEAASAVARATPPGARVVSDLPLVPLLAGRIAAPGTVDPSYVRVELGELSPAAIKAASESAGAVVIGRAFRLVPGLEQVLTARFRRVQIYGDLTVWTGPRSGVAAQPAGR